MDCSGYHNVNGFDSNYSTGQNTIDNNSFSISAVISTSCVILEGQRDIFSGGPQGTATMSSGTVCTSPFLPLFSPAVDPIHFHCNDMSSALHTSNSPKDSRSSQYAIPAFESAASEFVVTNCYDNSISQRPPEYSVFPIYGRVWSPKLNSDNQNSVDVKGKEFSKDDFSNRYNITGFGGHGTTTLSAQNDDFNSQGFSMKLNTFRPVELSLENKHLSSPVHFLQDSSLLSGELQNQQHLLAPKNRGEHTLEDTEYWGQTSQCDANGPSTFHNCNRAFGPSDDQGSFLSFLAGQQNVETTSSNTSSRLSVIPLNMPLSQEEIPISPTKVTNVSSRSKNRSTPHLDWRFLGQKGYSREENNVPFQTSCNRPHNFDNTMQGRTNRERSKRLHETNFENALRKDRERTKASYSMSVDEKHGDELEPKVKCRSDYADPAMKYRFQLENGKKTISAENKQSSSRIIGGKKRDGDTVESLQHQLEMWGENRKKAAPPCASANVLRHQLDAEKEQGNEVISPLVDVDHMICSGVTVAGFKPRAIIRKKSKTATPTNVKDTGYWQKRRKNNDSARKSRESKKEKEKNFYKRALELEYENVYLQDCLTLAVAELAALGQQFIPPMFGNQCYYE